MSIKKQHAHKDSFYEHQYKEVINLLAHHHLWNPDLGPYFLPLIRYCMPPPSMHHIYQLLECFIKININTDWAPNKKIHLLKNKIFHYTSSEYNNTETQDIGKHYPIFYGIRRIASLPDWPIHIKRNLIIEFTEIIYRKTGSKDSLSKNELYYDVYQYRDILISESAKKYNLKTHKYTEANLIDKKLRINCILERNELFGNSLVCRTKTPNFWDNAPRVPFIAQAAKKIKKSTKNIENLDIDEDEKSTSLTDSVEYMFNNKLQEDASITPGARWAISNVRSLSNHNQLPLNLILSYWEMLLEKNRKAIFKISLISLITGLRKHRWIKQRSAGTAPANTEQLHIDLLKNELTYTTINGATNFDNNDHFNLITLQLPSELMLTNSEIKAGINEDRSVRDFNDSNPGPTLRLNNIARSGHILLRRTHANETIAHTLSGNIPIEFKTRSAYCSISNHELNLLFRNCFATLAIHVNKHSNFFRRVHAELQKYSFDEDIVKHKPKQSIGSQIFSPNWDFSTFTLKAYHGVNPHSKAKAGNLLELYYYWMVQFALATRASGRRTESYSAGDYWIYKDKDSIDFIEPKILYTPALVKNQFLEITKCRQKIISSVTDKTHRDFILSNQSHLMYFTIGSKIRAKILYSIDALKLTKELFEIEPLLKRPNAHRHQSANFAHNHLGEIHADSWLGHYIDGWQYSGPDSSSSIAILNDLLKLQDFWLKKTGFKIIKNPLV